MTNPVAFDKTLVRGKARQVAETASESLFPDLLPEAQRKPARTEAQLPGQAELIRGDNMIGHMIVRGAEEIARSQRAQRSASIRKRTEELKARTGMPGSTLAVREGSVMAHRAGPPVDSQLVLGYVGAMLAEYASFPSAAALDAVTLWCAHAHIRDDDGRLAFRATPRLLLMSSQPGSGKSRVLELLGRLCPYTYGLDTEPTAAGLAHTLDKEHATALIDEADVLFGAGKRKEAVRAVVNSGYTSNGTVLRMKGSHAERARVFGPMALAGLDVLEKSSGSALDATLDRCVIIRMVRSGGHVADLNAKADRAGALLKGALTAWAQSATEEVTGAEPELARGRARPHGADMDATGRDRRPRGRRLA